MTFGEYITQARTAKKLRKSELAKKTGISAQYVMFIEDDKMIPSEDVIQKLIGILELNEKLAFKLADKLPPEVIEQAKIEYYGDVDD